MLRYHFEPGTLSNPEENSNKSRPHFYGKRADAAVKDMILPVGLENANLLKYEMRLNGRLSKLLRYEDIRALNTDRKAFL